ncbi:MAG: DUF1549 domain-containing protein [Pirellulaceae bacterium]
MQSNSLLVAAVLALLAAICSPTVHSAEPRRATAEQRKFFESKVRPLLAENCYKCHGPDKQKGDLRLDAISTILEGGESGPALVPGKPEESLLIEAVNYQSYEMPPAGKMKDEQIAILQQWVKIGAPWPDETAPVRVAKAPKITEEDRTWWAYQPVREVAAAQVDDGGWSKNEIDQFVFRRLSEKNLTPADEADRIALLRRAYFDLHGLPPSPEETEQFLADTAPGAYERLIDRLLESPRYGERWARHWLDVVRYAESDGYREDAYRPHAWRYRDYVVRALNDDKPYDEFIREQLAGDEIAPTNPDALAATGFLRLWIYEHNQRDVRAQWDAIINDITNVTSDVFLAVGMGCARCHDHKFDPVLQEDYFRMRAFFEPLLARDDLPLATHAEREAYEAALAAWEAKTADLRQQLDEIERPHLDKLAESAISKFPKDIQAMMRKAQEDRLPHEQQLVELAWRQVDREQRGLDARFKGEDKEKRDALLAELAKTPKPKPLPTVYTVSDVGAKAPPTTIPGSRDPQLVPPGFLTILEETPAEIAPLPQIPETTGRRTALADWIASRDNPLSTRVIVNRIWQHHFGRGLVATPSDFGHLGEPPSHPELLDWLTTWFVDGDWKLKRLHKLIMTSAAYRQTALREAPDAAQLADPENRLLWRFPLRRLSSDQIRDAVLLATGELDAKSGGASVEASSTRRTIYTKVFRNQRHPLLDVFDTPDGYFSVSERNVTTTPTQALLMINGPWMLDRARAMARRLQKEIGTDEQQLAERAYALAFGRTADAEEISQAAEFLRQQAKKVARPKQESLEPATREMPHREGTAALLTDDAKAPLLKVNNSASLPSGDFTVEAVILLESLYKDATVRTIAAQWDSNQKHPGWALGVTSEKSRYKPRNLILQLIGDPAKGAAPYEVIASNLRPELNKPYYVAVSVRIGEKSESGVTFYLKDLSDVDAPLQTASAAHEVTRDYRSDADLTIGGRDGSPTHRWDGLIDELKISTAALPRDELLIGKSPSDEQTVGRWTFDKDNFFADASPAKNHLAPLVESSSGDTPQFAALVDFCHVLLNSNEFLYVE